MGLPASLGHHQAPHGEIRGAGELPTGHLTRNHNEVKFPTPEHSAFHDADMRESGSPYSSRLQVRFVSKEQLRSEYFTPATVPDDFKA
jgi:hypothetical protein